MKFFLSFKQMVLPLGLASLLISCSGEVLVEVYGGSITDSADQSPVSSDLTAANANEDTRPSSL